MFICDFCGCQSVSGQAEKLVVTQWRAKMYPSMKLDPLPGTMNSRWTNTGFGHEAAEVKRSCTACDKKNAPAPAKENVNAPALQTA